ncbi:hypothetical protein [Helcobacillus massiliensis]|uniref:hypothetical protein n=1 Tax=Helcobacillus massiliensis TaxID=521392 RepID=UPI0025556300|nr:hypothetical protein [Helcobacillus massiliensis]MDK7741486.1 hypothetical protein [Helcobacillus massiliensis]WOO92394.1 hypothetical protein R3I40_08205 [Helcobacillus massiliensis]
MSHPAAPAHRRALLCACPECKGAGVICTDLAMMAGAAIICIRIGQPVTAESLQEHTARI